MCALCQTQQLSDVKDGTDKETEGNPYREESTKKLRDAGECCSVAFILRKTAAQEPQPALPHLVGQSASCGEELGALAALHISYPKRLHG